MKQIFAAIFAAICLTTNALSILEETVFVILSQSDLHHAKLASETKLRLERSAQSLNKPIGGVYDATKDLHQHGSWTIFPLILSLSGKLKLNHVKWFVFIDINSGVDLPVLETVLKSHQGDHFVGYQLTDSSHTIIHHFQEPGTLKYPSFPCGFALSGDLIQEVGFSLDQHGRMLDWLPSDFSIDAQFELSKALSTRDPRHVLVHDPGFCIEKSENCAIYPVKTKECSDKSGSTIEDLNRQTLFAIKTCEKYHFERLPIIKSTWTPFAKNTLFASDLADSSLGTVQLEGIENTERGHCLKTMAIIKHFNQTSASKGLKWLVIADDDTILSVYRLLDYLQCYNPDEDIHLGQRYGYRIAYGSHGYDYITGGGAMIFSSSVVSKIVKSTSCKCKSKDAPDDMHLGACLSNLGISLIHSPRFHQARPEDYAEDYLKTNEPISFHKFWNTDPHKVYDTWFKSSDEANLQKTIIQQHEEL